MKKVTAPWKPKLKDEKDAKYFATYEGENDLDGKKLSAEFQSFFDDF